tara:strand:+ start:1520 stop:2269 length:750 start_codon:yes stop_codon:yes gene_type:complete
MQLSKGDVSTALIDADIMLYRAAWKHEGDDVENAYETVDAMFEHIFYVTKCVQYLGFLTGRGNFRKELAVTKEYKGNRKEMVMPEHFHAIRDYLLEAWECKVVDGLEADDALGICQSNMDKTIICSIDKDLLQIKGLHYNWNKGEVSRVDAFAARYMKWKQVLSGDSTDNIVGIPRVGDKTAEKILDKALEDLVPMSVAVGEAYDNHFKDTVLSIDKMVETFNLTTIATSTDDSRFKEPFIIPSPSYVF